MQGRDWRHRRKQAEGLRVRNRYDWQRPLGMLEHAPNKVFLEVSSAQRRMRRARVCSKQALCNASSIGAGFCCRPCAGGGAHNDQRDGRAVEFLEPPQLAILTPIASIEAHSLVVT